jgi:hypothetical protein
MTCTLVSASSATALLARDSGFLEAIVIERAGVPRGTSGADLGRDVWQLLGQLTAGRASAALMGALGVFNRCVLYRARN